MLTKEERVASLHAKMNARRRRQERRKTGVAGMASVVLSICLLFLVFREGTIHRAGPAGLYSGATMLFEGVGAYVVVAIISFTAAVVITVLCIRFQRKKRDQDKNKDEEGVPKE